MLLFHFTTFNFHTNRTDETFQARHLGRHLTIASGEKYLIRKGKRGQGAKTLFTFTLNSPGHLHRAVFAILVIFLMVFECIWGWGVGHLHKGWFIWFMDCDGSAATDGFLMFMSEYLVCVYMHPPVLMP